MGVRFACHECGKRLNIKWELGGKRGVCPGCGVRFRIPENDAETSVPLDGSQSSGSMAAMRQDDGPASSDSASTAADLASTGAPQPVRESPASNASAPVPEAAAPPPPAKTDLLGDDPNATWYVRPPSGGQYGPASGAILKEWIGEGRVTADSLLWRDGWPQWRRASEAIPDLPDHQPGGIAVEPAAIDPAATAPEQTEGSGQSGLSGQANLGSGRRARTARRVMWIGVLAAITLLLLVVLWIVALR